MFSFKHQNIIKYYVSRIHLRVLISVAAICSVFPVFSQEPVNTPDSIIIVSDTLLNRTDTIIADTAKKKPLLEGEITYSAQDSLIFSVSGQKVYLYDEGVVNYPVQEIGLTGDYIEFDYNSKIAMAAGAIDSTGRIAGKPEFTQGTEKFVFDTMRYNFDTKKAIIKHIKTQQGEGYLHSSQTKRLADGEIHVKGGKYTTCDADHPHFHIALTKAISIPGQRTISGPAYLVFEDIPLPLALPFGFFPNTNKRTSGFLVPEFRDEQRRGFGLENGGWYFAVNDYLDFSIAGSIFSRGTWGLRTISNYTKKYRYNGLFSAEFFINKINDDPGEQSSRDFKVSWSHSQDRKANPTRSFRASVDFSTSSFERQQGTSFQNILQNQKNSSISFTKSWPGTPFNLSANLNGSQNTRNRTVNLTLPSVNFNMDRIYPFRGKNSSGDYNWLENIQVSYTSRLLNRVDNIRDSLVFTKEVFEKMENGFSHTIPISLSNIKILNDIVNVTPSVSYNGALFPYYSRFVMRQDSSVYDRQSLDTIKVKKLTYAHAFAVALSVSAAPKLYGMYESKKADSKIMAVRHVMTPSVSASFSPDMGRLVPDYYRTYSSNSPITQRPTYTEYSIYKDQINPTPSVSGRSGSVSLRLSNNVEAKVRSKSDTTGQGKKIVILDNLDFATGYRPFAPDYKWSPLTMNGRSTLFNRNLQLQVSSTFDPYGLDTADRRINEFHFKQTGKFFRLTNAQVSIGFRLQSASGKKGESGEAGGRTDIEEDRSMDDVSDLYEEAGGAIRSEYVDFDIPWSVNFDYSWNYSKPEVKRTIRSSLRFNGDLSVTPKWKIGFNSSYDFIAKEFSATNISIYRDLHCWEMRFTVVPFGDYKSYSFTINAKSALLRDLKWDKRRRWSDNL